MLVIAGVSLLYVTNLNECTYSFRYVNAHANEKLVIHSYSSNIDITYSIACICIAICS